MSAQENGASILSGTARLALVRSLELVSLSLSVSRAPAIEFSPRCAARPYIENYQGRPFVAALVIIDERSPVVEY